MNMRVCLILVLMVSASMVALVGPSERAAASEGMTEDIVIEGDSELENSEYVKTGSGTQESPYEITDLDMGANSIRISNTTCNLKLMNIHFDEGTDYGIELYQTYFVTMSNISGTNRMELLKAISSHNTTFKDSIFADIPNGASFIYFKNSWGSKLLNCEIGSTLDAMITFSSGFDTEIHSNEFRYMTVTDDDLAYDDEIHDNVFNNSHLIVRNGHNYPSVHDNQFYLDDGYAMTIDYCRQLNVYNNTYTAPIGIFFPPTARSHGQITSAIYQCTFVDCGVGIGGAYDGNPTRANGYDFRDNLFLNCTSYAMEIFATKYVTIHRNIFIDNNGVDEVAGRSQCSQTPWGSWNGLPEYDKDGMGNYWSDHTGPDEDNDGIVDNPYIVPTMGQDNFPCTNLYFDNAKPELSLREADGDTTSTSYIELEWDAHDAGSGLKDLQIKVYDEEYDVLDLSSMSIFLSQGTHEITLSGTDMAGLRNSSSVFVRAKETKEVFEIMNYRSGDIVEYGENELVWKVQEYFPVAHQTLEINGNPTRISPEARSHPLNLTPGENIVTLKIHDGVHVERSITLKLIKDIEPPTIEVLSPVDGATYTNEYLSLVWSVSDDLKLDTAQWKVDDEEWAQAEFEMNCFVPFGEGAHVLHIKASDLAGSITEVEIPFSIGIDEDLRMISPANDLETNSKYLDLKWEYTGNFEWTRAQLRIGSNSEYRYIDSTEVHGIRIRDYARDTSDGPCEVNVRLLDEQGNHILGSNTIVLDTKAPKVLFDDIPGYPNIASTDVHVSWKGYEENTLSCYRVMIDDGEWEDIGLETGIDLSLESGSHVVRVEANDLAGNDHVYSLELNIDPTSPVIHPLSPSSQDIITDGYVDLTWQITESGEVERSVILLDGIEIRNATGLSRRSFIIEESGEHIISIVAWDSSGNQGSVDIPIIVDIDPAEIEWTSLPEQLTNQKDWEIEWSMNDDIGIYSVLLMDNDNEMEIDEDQLNSEIEFDDGEHVLELTVVDLGGHISTLKHEFRVDTMAPSILIDRERTLLTGDSIDLFYKVGDDPSGIMSIEVRVDEGVYQSMLSETKFTTDSLEEGNHVITIKVEDKAGNVKEEMYHFDVTGLIEEGPDAKGGSFALIIPALIFVAVLILTTSGWIFLRRRRTRKENARKDDLYRSPEPKQTGLLPASPESARNIRCLPPANNFVETVQGVNYHRPDHK